MAPVFARLGKQYRRQIEFVAVNAYDRPDIAKRFGVKDPFAPSPPEGGEEEEESGGLLSRLLGIFGRN
jgi:thiol-disulfide isomerase/thioredoxin